MLWLIDVEQFGKRHQRRRGRDDGWRWGDHRVRWGDGGGAGKTRRGGRCGEVEETRRHQGGDGSRGACESVVMRDAGGGGSREGASAIERTRQTGAERRQRRADQSQLGDPQKLTEWWLDDVGRAERLGRRRMRVLGRAGLVMTGPRGGRPMTSVRHKVGATEAILEDACARERQARPAKGGSGVGRRSRARTTRGDGVREPNPRPSLFQERKADQKEAIRIGLTSVREVEVWRACARPRVEGDGTGGRGTRLRARRCGATKSARWFDRSTGFVVDRARA